jgi:hypothetical protein
MMMDASWNFLFFLIISFLSSLSLSFPQFINHRQPPKIQQSKEAKALAAANSSKGKKKVRRNS